MADNFSVSTTTKKITPLVSGNPMEKPDDSEAQAAIEAIQNLKRQQAPQDETDWDAKLQEAKDLYKSNADRNAWLSLAQTIGQGLLRLGAANEGLKKGVDLSHVDLGPGYDVEGANKRNMQEYQMDVGNIESAIKRNRQNREDLQNEYNQEFQGELTKKKFPFEFEKFKYGQGEQGFREGMRDASRTNAYEQQTIRAEQRANERQSELATKEEARRLDQAIVDGRKKLAAANELSNNYLNYDQLKKKDQAALDKQMGDLAGKAGIESKVLEDIKSKSKEGTGVFGMFQSEDPAKKSQLINDQVVNPLREQLKQLEEHRRTLSQGRSNPQPAAIPQPDSEISPPADQSDRVKVRSKDGQVGTIPRNQLKQAIAQGYTEVQ